MVSRRHITSMKNTEEQLKQHKRAGEELFPMLMKQSRKSVVLRPGNLGSGTVSGSSSSQSGRGLHSGSHSQDEVPGVGGGRKSQRRCRAWSPLAGPLLWLWSTVGSRSRSREGLGL